MPPHVCNPVSMPCVICCYRLLHPRAIIDTSQLQRFGVRKLAIQDEPADTTAHPSGRCSGRDIGEASRGTSPPHASDTVPQQGSHPVLLQRGHKLPAVLAQIGRVPARPPPWRRPPEDVSWTGTDAPYAGKHYA